MNTEKASALPARLLPSLAHKIPPALRQALRKLGLFLRTTIRHETILIQAARPSFEKAQQLNSALYQPVHAIPAAALAAFSRRLSELCLARGYDQQRTRDWLEHDARLYLSLQEMETILPASGACCVLEMGGDSVVTDLMAERFPHAQILSTNGDLRQDWENPADSVDLIVSMEVLEHLTDPENSPQRDGFYRTGLAGALHESYRVLRKGGKCFITTPNAVAVNCLSKILSGNPAWVYPLHIREYSLEEMSAELAKAGFRIEKAAAIHCMTAPTGVDYTPVFHLLGEYGYETALRGDELFITAVK